MSLEFAVEKKVRRKKVSKVASGGEVKKRGRPKKIIPKDPDLEQRSLLNETKKTESMVSNGEVKRIVSADNNRRYTESSPLTERLYKINPKQFHDGNYRKIRVRMGHTQNLGNNESARVDVEIEDFCSPDKTKQAWLTLRKQCVDFIRESALDVNGFLDTRDGGDGKKRS